MKTPVELALRDALLAQLAAVLPRASYITHPEGETIVTFPARHPEVGDLLVRDDGDELVVHIGNLTHRHFGNYDDDLPMDAKAEDIAEQVVEFIRGVVREEVEFFGNGRGGGSRKRDLNPRGLLSRFFLGQRTYIWSGPLGGESDA